MQDGAVRARADDRRIGRTFAAFIEECIQQRCGDVVFVLAGASRFQAARWASMLTSVEC